MQKQSVSLPSRPLRAPILFHKYFGSVWCAESLRVVSSFLQQLVQTEL